MLANTAPAFGSCEDFASAAKEARRHEPDREAFAEFGARDEPDTAMDTAQRRLATIDNVFYRGARPV